MESDPVSPQRALCEERGPGQAREGMIVREYRWGSLSREFVSRWEELENRAIEGNAFLSPHFVLPALRHLPGEVGKDPILLAVESVEGRRLHGLGIFEPCRGTRLLPLRHLASWQCTHSFFDGLLLDGDRAVEAASAFFTWFREEGRRWHGVSFRNRSAGSDLSAVLDEAAARFGIVWREDARSERASIPPSQVPEDPLGELYSRTRRQPLRKKLRQLEAFGEVEFELNRCQGGYQDSLDSFLELEAMGWKGEKGTALKSDSGHERFAREMVAGFSEPRRLLFSELGVAGKPIATGVLFQSGRTWFFFKSGWDPRFAKCSPGVLTNLKILQTVRGLEGIDLVDGCALPGSPLGELWVWRRQLTTGVFPTTPVGDLVARAMLRLKHLKRRLRGTA